MSGRRLFSAWAVTFVFAASLRLLIDVLEYGAVTTTDIFGCIGDGLVLASVLVFGIGWIRTRGHRQRTVVLGMITLLTVAAFPGSRLL